MTARRVLVTGGAGFIGSTIALECACRHPEWTVVALDNLHRRGSELALPRLRNAGVEFVHGDVGRRADMQTLEAFDALVECSAEPSVLAGVDGATEYVVRSNLVGAYHCLEEAVRHDAQLIFLSTSRVYPVAALNQLRYAEGPTRFELAEDQAFAGASRQGIAEDFPMDGARTLYGATKLAAELLITEYAASFGIPTVINRCGVVAGPWQMGKVDQGVFTHWIASFYFRRELSYLGFAGSGKQVRDVLHVMDLADLIDEQLLDPKRWAGHTVNVGGGAAGSLSLRETSAICAELTGNRKAVGRDPQQREGDVPIYISDCTALSRLTTWAPRMSPREILTDIHAWIAENESLVVGTLGGT